MQGFTMRFAYVSYVAYIAYAAVVALVIYPPDHPQRHPTIYIWDMCTTQGTVHKRVAQVKIKKKLEKCKAKARRQLHYFVRLRDAILHNRTQNSYDDTGENKVQVGAVFVRRNNNTCKDESACTTGRYRRLGFTARKIQTSTKHNVGVIVVDSAPVSASFNATVFPFIMVSKQYSQPLGLFLMQFCYPSSLTSRLLNFFDWFSFFSHICFILSLLWL